MNPDLKVQTNSEAVAAILDAERIAKDPTIKWFLKNK